MMAKGLDQFIPFIVTVIAIVATDLLKGVGVGILVAMVYIIKANIQNAFYFDINKLEPNKAVIRLAEEVTFLNKAAIQKQLYGMPKNIDSITIDGRKSKFIDKDVIEVIKDFELNAISKGIAIELVDVTYKKKGKKKGKKEDKLQTAI